ncbi:hypothetical protein GE061_010669 [Apolygus lucorum]|uniref:Uncharacterized protein n=1 Tax=Apolygus lucorum TaxID=248454 RepID=A0A8S9XXZ3_APOLU|nr:hypothetical protein GE061_010669 [Apolygus lucorum]
MLRTKMRFHTIKIILLTSLVWVMVALLFLTISSNDCAGGNGWACSSSAAPLRRSEGAVAAPQVHSKGRGEIIDSLKERGAAQEWTYAKGTLKKWRPAPTVVEKRGRPGEMGKGVTIPPSKQALMKEKFKLNQFNLLASDMISLNRSLADVRQDG